MLAYLARPSFLTGVFPCSLIRGSLVDVLTVEADSGGFHSSPIAPVFPSMHLGSHQRLYVHPTPFQLQYSAMHYRHPPLHWLEALFLAVLSGCMLKNKIDRARKRPLSWAGFADLDRFRAADIP